jgi:hypothetical protein
LAACPTCQSCAVAGKQGTCSAAFDGMVCGTPSCDGADRLHPTPMCASGTCAQGAFVPCAPYGCNTAAPGGCNASCNADGDCAKHVTCTVASHTCGP